VSKRGESSEPVIPASIPPAPPEVTERYDEMIRAHFRRSRSLRTWSGMGTLALVSTAVVAVLMFRAFSVPLLAATMLYAVLYSGALGALRVRR
jgi:hypothetical protein